MKKIFWGLFVFCALFFGIYPVSYLFMEYGIGGFFDLKDPEILRLLSWKFFFYLHISFAGLALFIGWTGFVVRIRNKYPNLHRLLGKIYVLSVLLGSIAAFYIAFYGSGGPIAKVGFIISAILWFSFTLKAYLYIRLRQIHQHQMMMIFSYALCFGGVTLRLFSPIVHSFFTDFNSGYRIIAWLSWVPNLAIAYVIVKSKSSVLT